MVERPLFREPLIDDAALAEMRERNRRLVESFDVFKVVEFSTTASRESREQARRDFYNAWR